MDVMEAVLWVAAICAWSRSKPDANTERLGHGGHADWLGQPRGAWRTGRCWCTFLLGQLFIVPVAYWLLRISARATKHYWPRKGCSANGPGECGLFFTGRKTVPRLQRSAVEAHAALLQALLAEAENCG